MYFLIYLFLKQVNTFINTKAILKAIPKILSWKVKSMATYFFWSEDWQTFSSIYRYSIYVVTYNSLNLYLC